MFEIKVNGETVDRQRPHPQSQIDRAKYIAIDARNDVTVEVIDTSDGAVIATVTNPLVEVPEGSITLTDRVIDIDVINNLDARLPEYAKNRMP